jgi:putative membrane protein
MGFSQVRASRKRVAQAYADFKPEDLIIRDLLALDRTTLANERTFLSYIRTALGLAAAGGVLLKIDPENQMMVVLGVSLLIVAACIFVYGYRRFLQVRESLLSLNEQPER